MIRIRFVARH